VRFASLVSTSVAVEGLLLFSSAHTASADHSLATSSNLSFMDTLEARAARSLASLARTMRDDEELRDGCGKKRAKEASARTTFQKGYR
jgi:hypothetical protein